MVKFFTSGKALSTIAAALVIVIATSAACIAIASWTGVLPLTANAVEQVTFSDAVWNADNSEVRITLKNTGTADLYIEAIKIAGVNHKSISPRLDDPYLLEQGDSVTFVASIDGGFQHNGRYLFMVTTTKGNNFGPYSKTAP